MSVVLLAAAHADDEVLGRGTILKHISQGDEVSLAIMADGVSSRPHSTDADVKTRMDACYVSSKLLGVTSIHALEFR